MITDKRFKQLLNQVCEEYGLRPGYFSVTDAKHAGVVKRGEWRPYRGGLVEAPEASSHRDRELLLAQRALELFVSGDSTQRKIIGALLAVKEFVGGFKNAASIHAVAHHLNEFEERVAANARFEGAGYVRVTHISTDEVMAFYEHYVMRRKIRHISQRLGMTVKRCRDGLTKVRNVLYHLHILLPWDDEDLVRLLDFSGQAKQGGEVSPQRSEDNSR